jgi:hypothetical protein
MPFNWKQVLHVGATIAGSVVPGVAMVEQIATALGGLKGRQKQDAVVALVNNTLLAVEGVSAKDLANDADVEAATRAVIDAVVALQTVIARHAAAPV